jgi:hypothetical protein
MIATGLNFGAFFCGFGASWFWYLSASSFIPDPPAGAFAEQLIPAMRDYKDAERRAARANRMAAILSGLTTPLSALAALSNGLHFDS